MSPPVILLHAVTRDRHDFAGFSDRLPGVAAEARDLIGHGEAPRAPRYRVADYAAAVPLAGRPVLYGHSLGGLVALAAAAASPGAVRALVLEDPPLFESAQPRLSEGPFQRGFVNLLALKRGAGAHYALADWERLVAPWPSGHDRLSLAEWDGDAVRRRARQLAAFDAEVLPPLIDGTVQEGFDVIAALAAAACPVILLAGARERGSALTAGDLARLAAAPNVTVRRIPGEGHYLREGAPAECAEAVREGLAA